MAAASVTSRQGRLILMEKYYLYVLCAEYNIYL